MHIISEFFQVASHIVIYYLLPFVVVLGVMIFFHELGHFITAKYFRVKVLKFALGFGPKIVAKEAGETEYSIRYVPLGGFVKMLGEDEDEEDEDSKPLTPDDMERAFNNQHPLKRIAIVAAGPLFNLVLAFFLFCGMFLIAGNYIMTSEIGQVKAGSPADKAGLKAGDVVVSVQGQAIDGWEDLKGQIQKQYETIKLTVRRTDRLFDVTIIPEEGTAINEFGEEIRSAQIGIVTAGKYEVIELGAWLAIKESIKETWKWIKLTCLVVVKLFQGVVSIRTVGGPIMIGQLTGQLAEESFSNLIPFMAVISINLGILNLFPIPILDGGVIIFLFIELILGRPISIRKRELAQKIGLSLLIILMMIVFYNDILRLFQ
ncbi:MAG TPA: RIP metalloprotease RseP [Desulfatiglandales bacterium]|nr:RIP metalloprotease RseP [Desulfatiglandales bacterium]